eukprot:TRINITY_DN14986_c0_g1_i1.p2 TRINITY_DN14986_c0_g1~~TRINITY_DN14986_c0_g1_i1.p2  ORF type:complete len:201 (-),score=56.88 TRINITY_DN14986_c0_g1_i1:39-641(-)
MLLALKEHPKFPKTIVLASGSPRRAEILGENLGLEFRICKSTFAEDLGHDTFATPNEYVLATATAKAHEVFPRLCQAAPPPDLLISADTVVVRDGAVLEKPSNPEHARRMLASLSGRSHEVMTAVVLLTPGETAESAPTVESFVEVTKVKFHQLSEEVINAYIATGEPFDKAGGYGCLLDTANAADDRLCVAVRWRACLF